MEELTNILTSLGYKLTPDSSGWRTSALYRDGDNLTALKIFRDGGCFDFVTNEYFSLETLVQRTLKLQTTEEVAVWLSNNKFNRPETFGVITCPKLELPKKYDLDCLKNLLPDHSYWQRRGISDTVLGKFNGGVSHVGGTKGRYVFPIWNNSKEIIGFAARDIKGLKPNKWKLFGPKNEWVYPAFLNFKNLKGGTVILVEGIGDLLALFEAGIECGLVMFGINPSWKLINFLIDRDPKKIIIATNNDSGFRDSNAGNVAAEKIYSKLIKYFDADRVIIQLPDKAKDLNDQLLKHGKDSIIDLYKKHL